MRTWRNWQTRKIQVLMVERLCRFKSCCPHHVVRTTDGRLAFSAKNMRLFHGLIFFRYFGSLPPPRRTTGSSEIVTRTCLDISISRHSLSAFAVRQVLLSAPDQNNTNQDDKSRFVLFFARDFFGAIVRLDYHL